MTEKVNKRKVALLVVETFELFAVLFIVLYIMWVGLYKPMFTAIELDKLALKQVNAVFCDAVGGSEAALKELEKLNHRHRFQTYDALHRAYRYSAAHAAGITSFKTDNQDLSKINFEKSNALVFEAFYSADDDTLLSFLRKIEPLFDDDVRSKKLDESNKTQISSWAKNHATFNVYSTFSDSEKEKLQICKARLEDKLSGVFTFFNTTSAGTCIDELPEVGPGMIWKALWEQQEPVAEKQHK